MKMTSKQFLVLESIIGEAQIQIKDIDLYLHLIDAIKNTQQLDPETIEIDFDFDDLEIIQNLLLESDFSLKDINFVIELMCLIGMVNLIEPSIKKIQGVIMESNYKFIGPEPLSIIVKGICTTVLPGETIKEFFIPFFKKTYPTYLEVIQEQVIEQVSPTPEIKTIKEEIYKPQDISDVSSNLENIVNIVTEINKTCPSEIVSSSNTSLNTNNAKKCYPYEFNGKTLNGFLELKGLFKEELQTLAIELGLPSDIKIAKLRSNINTFLLNN